MIDYSMLSDFCMGDEGQHGTYPMLKGSSRKTLELDLIKV